MKMKLQNLLAVACAAVLTTLSTLSWIPEQSVLSVSAETAAAESEAQPRLYAERVSAKPGDKNVPVSVYIENNPCTFSYGFRLSHDPAVKVVLTDVPTENSELSTPKSTRGTVMEDAADFMIINRYNPQKNLIGSASLGIRDKGKIQNGALMTFYFDIPEDTPAGIYPLCLDCLSVLGYHANNIVDDFAVDSGYIKVEDTPTLDAPEIYGSFCDVAPGARHVPFTLSIRNNPGFSGMKVQLDYSDVLLPVMQGNTPECDFGDIIADGKTLSAVYPATHTLDVSVSGCTAAAKDGALYTCYFDIPDDLEDGVYPVNIQLSSFTDGEGADAAGQVSVFSTYFIVNNPDPYKPPTIYAAPVEANPGDKNVEYVINMKNNPGLTKINVSANFEPFTRSSENPPKPGWIRAGMDTQMEISNKSFSFAASTNQPRLPSNYDGYWGQLDGSLMMIYLDIPEDTEPGYYPIKLTVNELNDGLGADLMDEIVVENNYIKVGDPEGEPPVVTGTTRSDTKTLTGDYNADGDVTVADAVMLARFLAEDTALTDAETEEIVSAVPDFNSDGMLTFLDVRALLKAIEAE